MEKQMKSWISLCGTLLLLVAAGVAQNPTNGHGQANVEPVKAGTLQGVCKRWIASVQDKPAGLDNACQGYMIGWSWGVEGTMTPDNNGFVGTVTFEDGVTGVQMARVFVLYIENHPEEENKPAHVALMHAMLDARLVTLSSPGK
jgi:hypothetical protein